MNKILSIREKNVINTYFRIHCGKVLEVVVLPTD